MKRLSILACAALVFVSSALGGKVVPADGPYKVLKKYELGGEGGWDYLSIDAAARRLYIARASHVMVMDLDKGTVVGDLLKTPGVHGVALVPKLKKGFTSNGGDSTATIFDLETLKEIGRVEVGKGPDFILYDPASNQVFTFNASSKDATAIAADSGKVAGTVPLGGQPEAAVADGKGTIYVNIVNTNELVSVDAKQLKVTSRWPLAPGANPVGLGMDLSKRRLFSTCRNEKMVIVDADSGKVLDTVAIGKGTDACVFDAAKGLAFSSNKDGTLTVVGEARTSPDKYAVVENVTTQVGAKTMALDPKTHNLYLATAQFKEAGKKSTPVPNTFTILVVGQ